MLKTLRHILFASLVLTYASLAKAVVVTLPSDFPVASEVRKQVQFWEKVFFKYPSDSAIIHDREHPELIVDVVDFAFLARKKKLKN
ncbi:MAG: hypothetical protein HYW48_03415 [Deltaproteobacteria bacterium]|nr:hypothetical protein [Deltaproteobacteria bacterium]